MEPWWLCHALLIQPYSPQATSSWRRRGYRFSRWSQGQAGFESVNLLQHPVRANRTSKMWLMWLRMIPSFQRCTVFWEKSPLSVRKLCKNSCNGNYETPCIQFMSNKLTYALALITWDMRLSVTSVAVFRDVIRYPVLWPWIWPWIWLWT